MKYYWFIGNKRIAETYYRELLEKDEVVFISKDKAFKNIFLCSAFRFLFSQIVNSKIKMPAKKTIFALLLREYNVLDLNDTVLIFHEGWFDDDISNYLKHTYIRLKTVLYFDDTVETYSKAIPSLNPYSLKEKYDYVFAYNPSDVAEYGFIQYNACFSKLNISYNAERQSDLCFIGQPKDRYTMLKRIFDYLGEKCNCNFIVVGENDGDDNGIRMTTRYMDYEEYLQHEISSNCILEILKADTQGATFRCWEAVYYNRKLITNWKGITSFEYYDPRFMMYFEKPEDIDIDFVKSKIEVDYHYLGDNSPSVFLRNIEGIISGENC